MTTTKTTKIFLKVYDPSLEKLELEDIKKLEKSHENFKNS